MPTVTEFAQRFFQRVARLARYVTLRRQLAEINRERLALDYTHDRSLPENKPICFSPGTYHVDCLFTQLLVM